MHQSSPGVWTRRYNPFYHEFLLCEPDDMNYYPLGPYNTATILQVAPDNHVANCRFQSVPVRLPVIYITAPFSGSLFTSNAPLFVPTGPITTGSFPFAFNNSPQVYTCFSAADDPNPDPDPTFPIIDPNDTSPESNPEPPIARIDPPLPPFAPPPEPPLESLVSPERPPEHPPDHHWHEESVSAQSSPSQNNPPLCSQTLESRPAPYNALIRPRPDLIPAGGRSLDVRSTSNTATGTSSAQKRSGEDLKFFHMDPGNPQMATSKRNRISGSDACPRCRTKKRKCSEEEVCRLCKTARLQMGMPDWNLPCRGFPAEETIFILDMTCPAEELEEMMDDKKKFPVVVPTPHGPTTFLEMTKFVARILVEQKKTPSGTTEAVVLSKCLRDVFISSAFHSVLKEGFGSIQPPTQIVSTFLALQSTVLEPYISFKRMDMPHHGLLVHFTNVSIDQVCILGETISTELAHLFSPEVLYGMDNERQTLVFLFLLAFIAVMSEFEPLRHVQTKTHDSKTPVVVERTQTFICIALCFLAKRTNILPGNDSTWSVDSFKDHIDRSLFSVYSDWHTLAVEQGRYDPDNHDFSSSRYQSKKSFEKRLQRFRNRFGIDVSRREIRSIVANLRKSKRVSPFKIVKERFKCPQPVYSCSPPSHSAESPPDDMPNVITPPLEPELETSPLSMNLSPPSEASEPNYLLDNGNIQSLFPINESLPDGSTSSYVKPTTIKTGNILDGETYDQVPRSFPPNSFEPFHYDPFAGFYPPHDSGNDIPLQEWPLSDTFLSELELSHFVTT
jgi:hypothetical protein